MNDRINKIMEVSEGRYLTKKEQATILDYFSKVDARFKAMEEVESKEHLIANKTMEIVMRSYPDMKDRHQQGKEKGVRDLALILRYGTQAMVRDDMAYFDNALLAWLRTILQGIGFTPEFLGNSYKTLDKVASDELSEQTYELFGPYLKHLAEYMSTNTGAEVDAATVEA